MLLQKAWSRSSPILHRSRTPARSRRCPAWRVRRVRSTGRSLATRSLLAHATSRWTTKASSCSSVSTGWGGNYAPSTCSFRQLARLELPGLMTWQQGLPEVTLLPGEKRSFRLRQLRSTEAVVQFATALVRRVQDFEPG